MGVLSGKVAVVTGASKGIGAEIARTLAEAGAAVVVNYTSHFRGAATIEEDITSKGGKAISVKASVTASGDVARLFSETGQGLRPTGHPCE